MRAADSLDALERKVRYNAEAAAGLHEAMPEATLSEIRTALRGMSQNDRDQAVTEAFNAGDIPTVKAVLKSPSAMLAGTLKAPVKPMTDELISRAARELSSQLEAIEHAENFLNLSVDSFMKGAEKMRNPRLEAEAQQQIEATSEAEAALAAAIHGNI